MVAGMFVLGVSLVAMINSLISTEASSNQEKKSSIVYGIVESMKGDVMTVKSLSDMEVTHVNEVAGASLGELVVLSYDSEELKDIIIAEDDTRTMMLNVYSQEIFKLRDEIIK